MKTIAVEISGKANSSYPIFIGERLLADIDNYISLEKYSKYFVVSEAKLSDLFLQNIRNVFEQANKTFEVILIETGEAHKSLATAEKIWAKLSELNADRKSCLLNLGGGMLGDVAGFAAACYMRGIDFYQLPTTLLSQVDASVGGKLGVNFNGIKNIIGSFTQPQAVIIDIETLLSLPKREFAAGLAEIIKHALICDLDFLTWLEKHELNFLSPQNLILMIEKSCLIKAHIVSQDEKEIGLRKLLNFGHTAGHALESMAIASNYSLLHGEAVALGMLVEAKLSELQGNLSSDDFQRINDLLLKANLPLKYEGFFDEGLFFNLLLKDKKNESQIVSWTLLTKLGQGIYNQKVSEDDIREAIAIVRN